MESAPLPITLIVTLALLDFAALGILSWWILRSRCNRIAEAQRSAAEHARNAEIASMTRGLAHEIKNPLSTVALNAQLLREEILDSPLADAEREQMTRRVDALAREAARLRDILNDFLRYAGRMQLDRRTIDVRAVAEELTDFFMPQAEQAGVRLRLDAIDEAVPAEADPALLKQAVLNLLINGVQAMEQLPREHTRTLLLRVHSVAGSGRGAAARPPRAVIEVADTGPGVTSAARATIFEPYYTTKSGGNGLGLATARRIIEAHGGSIQLVDTPVGATFRIELPERAPEPPNASASRGARPREGAPSSATPASPGA